MISFGHAAFFGLGGYTMTIVFVNSASRLGSAFRSALSSALSPALSSAYPTFRLRGHYFALAMLAYPLAMLYVFQWMGYQEVPMPMKREAPLSMPNSAISASTWRSRYSSCPLHDRVMHIERSRFGMSLTAIKQNEPAASAAGINPLRWKMLRDHRISAAQWARPPAASMPGDSSGRHATDHVRRAGFGTGADHGAVRRRRHILGSGDRRRGAGAARRDSECQIRQRPARHSGRRVRRSQLSSSSLVAPEGIYWRVRDHFARPAANRGGPVLGKTPISVSIAETIEVAPRKPRRKQELRERRGPAQVSTARAARSAGSRQSTASSLNIRAGTIHGVIGPNGAGKTTLFNVINGFLAANSGSIRLAGTELWASSRTKSAPKASAARFR